MPISGEPRGMLSLTLQRAIDAAAGGRVSGGVAGRRAGFLHPWRPRHAGAIGVGFLRSSTIKTFFVGSSHGNLLESVGNCSGSSIQGTPEGCNGWCSSIQFSEAGFDEARGDTLIAEVPGEGITFGGLGSGRGFGGNESHGGGERVDEVLLDLHGERDDLAMEVELRFVEEEATETDDRVEGGSDAEFLLDVRRLVDFDERETDLASNGFELEEFGVEFLHGVGFAAKDFGVPFVVEGKDLLHDLASGGFFGPRLQYKDASEVIGPDDDDGCAGTDLFEVLVLFSASGVEKGKHVELGEGDEARHS